VPAAGATVVISEFMFTILSCSKWFFSSRLSLFYFANALCD
jgi:hypothetical protein